MKRSFLVLLPLMALTMSLYGQADPTVEQLLTESEKKFEDFDKVVKNAKQHDGLFHLFHKEENVHRNSTGSA